VGALAFGAVGSVTTAAASAATPLTFAAAQPMGVSAAVGGLSCPSTTLCVAGDDSGQVLFSTDPASPTSAWTHVTIPAADELTAASCATTTFCVLGDNNTGNVYVSHSPTVAASASWTSVSVNSYGVNAVACPSTTVCVAATGDGASISNDGGMSWTAVTGATFTPGFQSVSCPSTSLCVLVGHHIATTLTALSSGATAVVKTDSTADAAYNLAGVSCPSVSSCVAVDSQWRAVVSTNLATPAWGSVSPTAASSAFKGIDCPLVSLCVAVDDDGDASFSTNPGSASWTLQSGITTGGTLFAVSCPQSGLCVAVGQSGYDTVATGATLAVSLAGTSGGTVTDSDGYIDCGTTCSGLYAGGSPVTLTETPPAGAVFAGWSGAGCSGTAPTCTVTNGAAGSSQTVVATFAVISLATTPPAVAAPTPAITGAKISSKHHSATFSFDASGTVTGYRCAIVRKPRATRRHRHPKAPRPVYSRCGSPKAYKRLKAAHYTFYVRAVGPGGTSATAATRAFTIR
jgi:Divergent InlB B-repeat domain